MTKNKKPVLIVALFLAALIVIPLLLLLITRVGGSISSEIGGGSITVNQKETDIADFDLRQLAEKADNLIEQDLAKALREGDVSLDFMSDLKRNAKKGRETAVATNSSKYNKKEKTIVWAWQKTSITIIYR